MAVAVPHEAAIGEAMLQMFDPGAGEGIGVGVGLGVGVGAGVGLGDGAEATRVITKSTRVSPDTVGVF